MDNISKNTKAGIDEDLYHITVLKEEVIKALEVKPGKKYIDATLGGGGHSFEILKLGGDVLGIDCDNEALEYVNSRWKMEGGRWKGRLTLVHGNFRNLTEIAKAKGFEKVAGIIFDLGTSRHQLKAKNRGFSFRQDEELDMRMDKTQDLTAKKVINSAGEKELYEIFTKLGEEKLAQAIASAILRARSLKPISSTEELARIVRSVKHTREKTDAATKVFQAMRIYVNDELQNLKSGLEQAIRVLELKGRIAIISFHSLEDRMVKNYFRNEENLGRLKIVTKKPVTAKEEELRRNPSARSAKLRIATKL